jgi:hypothetical protein
MKRHPIDPLSFLLGAFFLITGLVFAFGGDASKLHIAWFWPVVLGVTGLGLMLLTIRSVRPERPAVATASVDETAETAPADDFAEPLDHATTDGGFGDDHPES